MKATNNPVMDRMNRTRAPRSRAITNINIQHPRKQILPNGIPLYSILCGNYDIVRIDFLFAAGTSTGDFPLVAQMTNAMLTEGSSKYTSAEIARKLDYYGAFVEPAVDVDTAGIVVYTLGKFAEPVLHLVEEFLKHPSFPPKELNVMLGKRKQHFIIDQQKVKTMARQRFSEVLFGKEHPYGRNTNIHDFDRVNRNLLMEYHKHSGYAGNCTILVSGRFDTTLVTLIENLFGGNDWLAAGSQKKIIPPPTPHPEKKHHIDRKDALQSAVRIGRLLVNKKHPDYAGLLVLNTLLGGYFGSRLMKNIREEKGYTYGIGSFILSMHNAGCLVIVSEVGTDVTGAAIREIYREIEGLCTRPVPAGELRVVKNYMMGELVREFDGPFALAESVKGIIEYGLDTGFFYKIIQAIKTITPGELLNLARKYLDTSEMYEVVAGRK